MSLHASNLSYLNVNSLIYKLVTLNIHTNKLCPFRCNFKAYCIFSFFNTAVYCIPAGWVWGEHGFLNRLGVVDIAGSGPVHLIGGTAAFASAAILGPRLGRYAEGIAPLPLVSMLAALLDFCFFFSY